MTRRHHRRPSVLVWGFAALVVTAVSSAGPARAECGDHVHIGPAAPVAGADAPAAPKPAKPCDGPNCSLRDAPAPLAPVTPPAEPGPTDAILAADPPPDPAATGRPLAHSIHLPDGADSGIFHPPRLG